MMVVDSVGGGRGAGRVGEGRGFGKRSVQEGTPSRSRKYKYFLYLKIGHISYGFKMSGKKLYLSVFSTLRDLQRPYEFSSNLCSNCNRLRETVQGNVTLSLNQGVENHTKTRVYNIRSKCLFNAA